MRALLLSVGAALLLACLTGMYLRADFVVDLANRVWTCFG
ncbi:hypothetical protein HNO92_004001 [Chromobacterium alkanivorans]|nr:hypothetical protein [Chromobacterium alkanivorans]MCS3818032.1 hypothetical protein [Chromobacterium alkanivorans]MCS3875652.1 hypothetical protein [Chromobacterium alkanivorans]BBH13166.1 hypothetical protein CH06BL_24140 [Chromobacterium haemolyticum]